MGEERLLTESGLLAALNIDVDRTAVWRWRKKGMPFVKVGRAIRYDLAAVQKWLLKETSAPDQWKWSVWSWAPTR